MSKKSRTIHPKDIVHEQYPTAVASNTMTKEKRNSYARNIDVWKIEVGDTIMATGFTEREAWVNASLKMR